MSDDLEQHRPIVRLTDEQWAHLATRFERMHVCLVVIVTELAIVLLSGSYFYWWLDRKFTLLGLP